MCTDVSGRAAPTGFPLPDLSPARGRRILVALSGGADSVALIHLLAQARQAYGLTLYAAHMDHGIRPRSGEDADFCRELCARLDVPLYVKRIDIPALAAAHHRGLESEARDVRRQWLDEVRRQTNADLIATAHHMDDQAETVLMRLARGTGLRGMGGIAALRDGYYRPLLGLRKAQLAEYLRAREIPWREDDTNRVDDNPRNAIRLHVIPELEKHYPGFVPAAARFADSARLDDACLNELAQAHCAEHGGRCLPFCTWLDLSAPLHPALLRRALRALCPGWEALTWAQVNALEALCARPRGKLDLGRYLAERTGRRLYFVTKDLPAFPPTPLQASGETVLPGLCRVQAGPCAPVPERSDPMVQVLDARSLEGAEIRTRRPGDRFRPLGCGDRLLSDFLIDRKVDRPLRDALALVAREDRVLWVCGLGISQEARLTEGTTRAVRLNCRYDFDMETALK